MPPLLHLSSDPYDLEKMYIAKESGAEGGMKRCVTVRGTSQLEGYHHHLADLFVGANYSAYLAGALVTYFNFRCVSRGTVACVQSKKVLCESTLTQIAHAALVYFKILGCCPRSHQVRP